MALIGFMMCFTCSNSFTFPKNPLDRYSYFLCIDDEADADSLNNTPKDVQLMPGEAGFESGCPEPPTCWG